MQRVFITSGPNFLQENFLLGEPIPVRQKKQGKHTCLKRGLHQYIICVNFNLLTVETYPVKAKSSVTILQQSLPVKMQNKFVSNS